MSICRACAPMSWSGWASVVSGGVELAASGMSSKPITERSSGTRSPSSRATWSTPSADISFAANTAVGRSPRVSRSLRGLCRLSCLVAAVEHERGVEGDPGFSE